jgi:hypothetical protein
LNLNLKSRLNGIAHHGHRRFRHHLQSPKVSLPVVPRKPASAELKWRLARWERNAKHRHHYRSHGIAASVVRQLEAELKMRALKLPPAAGALSLEVACNAGLQLAAGTE